jgi:hypothetical protein
MASSHRAIIEPQLFVAPKPGESMTTCQDVGWFGPLPESGASGFAVADGATGGWDGQRWAELAVDAAAEALGFLDHDGTLGHRWVRTALADRLEAARDRWTAENHSAENDDDPVAVLARTKFLRTGGHCTLALGVLAPDGSSLRLDGLAVGDTPVFHIADAVDAPRLAGVGPQTRSAEFDRDPVLLSSRPAGPGEVVPGLVPLRFDRVDVGDCVLVMTDALAAWALRRAESGHPAWRALCSIDAEGFDRLVGRTRAGGELVADDTLLLRLHITARPLPLHAPQEGGR